MRTPVDTSVSLHGIDERRQLELRTPHGCSKRAAEQHVLDLEMIERLRGRRPKVVFAPPRDGDQRYYASNTRAFQVATGWRPRIAPSAGIEALHHWLVEHAASPSGPRHA
jgi:dTDP-D-glucose 4,6-dehydratase